MLSFYEFFAGGGMARAGLGAEWRCLFANDFDHKKGLAYRAYWGDAELKTADVASLRRQELPGHADLAWASFPCQDLSLAGAGAGLGGERSGTFWPFWNLMKGLVRERRGPRMIVLENVCGTLTSHNGEDFAAICEGFRKEGYVVGALVIDAALFVPQSRPRLFILGVKNDIDIPDALVSGGPSDPWHTRALRKAHENLPRKDADAWRWWRLPAPAPRSMKFEDIIEDEPKSSSWFTAEETRRLLAMMSPTNHAKVNTAKRQGGRIVGGVYKRMRQDADGHRVQRAEVRFDDVSGCLRTPAGGSSRQVVVFVEGRSVKARLISSRETARLMGLPDDYALPEKYNEAYNLTGDGVVVPVVRHLAKHLFEPLLEPHRSPTLLATVSSRRFSLSPR
jgi:DNA (cytosine-5)-methyltransferase 1